MPFIPVTLPMPDVPSVDRFLTELTTLARSVRGAPKHRARLSTTDVGDETITFYASGKTPDDALALAEQMVRNLAILENEYPAPEDRRTGVR